jgi:hypothetical protein
MQGEGILTCIDKEHVLDLLVKKKKYYEKETKENEGSHEADEYFFLSEGMKEAIKIVERQEN